MLKLSFLITFLIVGLVLGVSTAAPPPACILACVNQQDSVSDLKAVCATSDLQSCLSDRCDSAYKKAALSFAESVCKGTGHNVANGPSTSSSASGSYPSSVSGVDSSKDPAASSASSTSGDKKNAGIRVGGNAYTCIAVVAMVSLILI